MPAGVAVPVKVVEVGDEAVPEVGVLEPANRFARNCSATCWPAAMAWALVPPV